MSRHVVTAVAELPPGGRKLITVNGRSIAVFNVNGEFFALQNRCPHRGGSLCEGRLTGLVQSSQPGEYEFVRQGEILRCPWHGWEFDIRTGRSQIAPAKIRTLSFPVLIESGANLTTEVTLERYPVSIEEDYVVLTVP